MPTALKYFLKDLAESEGWYLTGEDKSKTVASQAKRISLETTNAKSRLTPVRISKVEVKELAGAVNCVVSYGKKPGADDFKRHRGHPQHVRGSTRRLPGNALDRGAHRSRQGERLVVRGAFKEPAAKAKNRIAA